MPKECTKTISLEKGSIMANARVVQALYSSQKGKRNSLTFTLGVSERGRKRGGRQDDVGEGQRTVGQ